MTQSQLAYQRQVIREDYITDQEVSRRVAEIKDQSDTKKRGGSYGRSKNQLKGK